MKGKIDFAMVSTHVSTRTLGAMGGLRALSIAYFFSGHFNILLIHLSNSPQLIISVLEMCQILL